MGESKQLFAENGNEKDVDGCTALHRASFWNYPEIARALIEAKVTLNVQTRSEEGFYGTTALHLAVMGNHLEIGGMLLDAGARVNLEDFQHCTPLNLAEALGHMEFVNMLLHKMLQNHLRNLNL